MGHLAKLKQVSGLLKTLQHKQTEVQPKGEKTMPQWIQDLRNDLSIEILLIVDEVWKNREKFIHWPTQPLLFMPGTVRNTARFHEYNVDQLRELGAMGVTVDRRSNGPAIMAYLLAGDIRPRRANGRRCWSIHHIYDGQHPHPQRDTTIRAVAHGDHFTQTAGLVAIQTTGGRSKAPPEGCQQAYGRIPKGQGC